MPNVKAPIGSGFSRVYSFKQDGSALNISTWTTPTFYVLTEEAGGGAALVTLTSGSGLTVNNAAGTVTVTIAHDSAHWTTIGTTGAARSFEFKITNPNGVRITVESGRFSRPLQGMAAAAPASNGLTVNVDTNAQVASVEIIDATGVAAAQALAETAQTAAEVAQAAAEAALDGATAAVAGIGIYASTAAGIADTVNGEYFYVLNTTTGTLTLYENVTESATARGSSVYFSQSDAALSQAYLGDAWRWNGAPTRDATSTLPTSGNIVWWDGSAGAFTGTVSGFGYTENVLTHTNSGKTLTATITTDADGSQRVTALAFS
jgi:hypothetical protein